MKNMNTHLNECIKKCQHGIDALQKVSELCTFQVNAECATQLGKSVKACDEIIVAAKACAEECQNHMSSCDNATCKKHCKECIDACNSTIAFCKRVMGECNAQKGECLTDSVKALKQLTACAQACQKCLDHKH
jgi:hypothetical protein